MLVTEREPLLVQVDQLFAFVAVQACERVPTPARLHGVDQAGGLVAVAQHPLQVEHAGERDRLAALDLLGRGERHDVATTHEREGAVERVGRVLEAERRTPAAAAPAPHVAVMGCRAVDLRRHVLGEARGLRRGAPAVDRRVVSALGIDVVADVAHVRLDHVAAEPYVERETTEQVAHAPAERVLVPGVRAFERHDGAALPRFRLREVHGEARVAVGEPAVDVAVRQRRLPPLVDVDVGRTEERVGHLVRRAVDALGCGHGSSPGSSRGRRQARRRRTLPRRSTVFNAARRPLRCRRGQRTHLSGFATSSGRGRGPPRSVRSRAESNRELRCPVPFAHSKARRLCPRAPTTSGRSSTPSRSSWSRAPPIPTGSSASAGPTGTGRSSRRPRHRS